jgi:hypothetical protein
MSLLGITEGAQSGLLNVIVKYYVQPSTIGLALEVIPSDLEFKFAIDQDGTFYMKFKKPEQAEAVARRHYFIGGKMIKFYYVKTVEQLDEQADRGKLPFYKKHHIDDFYELF